MIALHVVTLTKEGPDTELITVNRDAVTLIIWIGVDVTLSKVTIVDPESVAEWPYPQPAKIDDTNMFMTAYKNSKESGRKRWTSEYTISEGRTRILPPEIENTGSPLRS